MNCRSWYNFKQSCDTQHIYRVNQVVEVFHTGH